MSKVIYVKVKANPYIINLNVRSTRVRTNPDL